MQTSAGLVYSREYGESAWLLLSHASPWGLAMVRIYRLERPDGNRSMQLFDYRVRGVESETMRLASTKVSFGLCVSGWRRHFIRVGLRYYLRYRDALDRGNRRSWIALLVIPFGFITPTFWVICVRAELNSMRPRIDNVSDPMVVVFEKL